MPSLTMRPTGTCPICGCRLRGFNVGAYRINKNSLVSTSPGLSWVECPECGPEFTRHHPTGLRPESLRWRLDAESQQVVDRHRRKKGWPT